MCVDVSLLLWMVCTRIDSCSAGLRLVVHEVWRANARATALAQSTPRVSVHTLMASNALWHDYTGSIGAPPSSLFV